MNSKPHMVNKQDNFLEKLHDDIKQYQVSTIEERAKRLYSSKWDIFDALIHINPSLINGKGFDVSTESIKRDYELYPLSSFMHRARRLNVYATVVMKMTTLIPISELIK